LKTKKPPKIWAASCTINQTSIGWRTILIPQIAAIVPEYQTNTFAPFTSNSAIRGPCQDGINRKIKSDEGQE
jgi:hypothetical protein